MHRPERIAETLREEIAQIVGYELEDPQLAMITVTEVRVADDLRDASVYVTVEGDEREHDLALRALRHAGRTVWFVGTCRRLSAGREPPATGPATRPRFRPTFPRSASRPIAIRLPHSNRSACSFRYKPNSRATKASPAGLLAAHPHSVDSID